MKSSASCDLLIEHLDQVERLFMEIGGPNFGFDFDLLRSRARVIKETLKSQEKAEEEALSIKRASALTTPVTDAEVRQFDRDMYVARGMDIRPLSMKTLYAKAIRTALENFEIERHSTNSSEGS